MGALDQIEHFLQDLVERPAWLMLPKGLQPVQLVSALTKELEAQALRLPDRVVIPNTYILSLADEDFAPLKDVKATLERQLSDYVERLASERDLSLPADPAVSIRVSSELQAGHLAASSSFPSTREVRPGYASQPRRRLKSRAYGKTPETSPPALTLLGSDGEALRRFTLDRPSMTLGRRSTNEISIVDLKISRRHLQLEIRGSICYVSDLRSTNGTRVNGSDVDQKRQLEPGDIIEVGLQRLRYECQMTDHERPLR